MAAKHYLSWATGDPHYVFGVETWEWLRLLLVRKECIKMLQLIVAAPAVHLPVVSECQAVCRTHSDVHNFLSWWKTQTPNIKPLVFLKPLKSVHNSQLTLKTVEQLRVANMLIGAMTKALVVSLSPCVHLAIFGEGHRELAAAGHLHYVQVLQLFNKFGSLAAITAPSAQFTIVSVPPGPHLTCRYVQNASVSIMSSSTV